MKNHKKYIFVLFSIFTFQMLFFIQFLTIERGSKVDKLEIELLKKKNKELEAELQTAFQSKRKTASIGPNESNVNYSGTEIKADLSSFYFLQFENYKKNAQKKQALDVLQKIKDNVVDPDKVAQAFYEKIDMTCSEKLETECLQEIDALLTQFPDSKWSAKGLLLLSHFYFKQNRQEEARSLIRIIKNDFKSYDELNTDIEKISKRKL